jgi:hypothetical protein
MPRTLLLLLALLIFIMPGSSAGEARGAVEPTRAGAKYTGMDQTGPCGGRVRPDSI